MSFEKIEIKEILMIFFSVFIYLVANVLLKALAYIVNILLVPIILALIGQDDLSPDLINTIIAQSIFALTIGAGIFIILYYKIQKLGTITMFAVFYSIFLYALGMRPLLWFAFIVFAGILADIILNLSAYKNKHLAALAYAVMSPVMMIFSMSGIFSFILPVLASFAGVYLMYNVVTKRV